MTAYVPPTIGRDLASASNAMSERNRFSLGPASDVAETIDGVAVSELAARFGSPLFVFSERTLRATVRRARAAFRSRYPNTTFAWSYKTNYLGAICRVFHQEGSIAEVVSDFEYEKARSLGVPGREIIFNGPHKSRAILERATAEGAHIQVDNWDELLCLESIAEARGEPVSIALRVWLDAGIRPIWSKFGFALENGEVWRVLQRIAASGGKLVLTGLHTHIGTYILDPRAYRTATEKLVGMFERIHAAFGWTLPFINLGGGFPSRSTLHYTQLPIDEAVPPIEDYAEAICGVLNSLPSGRRPRLFLESGRALVDEAGSLITTVVAVKGGTRGGSPDLAARDVKANLVLGQDSSASLLVDAGVNLLYTGAWYRFDVRPARPAGDVPKSLVKLYGCLCMNIDVLREQVALPPQDVGDHLVLHPVGAYNITQSMQFITYRPAVVLVCEDGEIEVIRERETLEDVTRGERMPAWLQA